MKKLIAILAVLAALTAGAEKIVILHTNDTHSSIEPDKGVSGILQRKAIVDSVRRAEKNVLLIDAGDVVQGTLYFKFFGGDVEFPLMNMMDYDVRILGNHEFDNGLDALAHHWKSVKGARLSANYDFTDTPLKGMFEPYVIKKIGGKKIGIMGLNVDPESLIARQNIGGMKFKDIIKTANETAAYLKQDKKCDMVIAVTHIGYTSDSGKTTDVDLAKASKDIDIIIGGHSHTLVSPDKPEMYLIPNAEGRDVLVTQTGKYGRNIGEIMIDTAKKGPEAYTYSLIPVTDRFPDEMLDQRMKAVIAPYKAKVDSVNARVIARSLYDLNSDDRAGGYANWAGDYARNYAQAVLDTLMPGRRADLGLMNVGGIRQNMPKGDVTEGQMLSTFPFANYMVILEIKGSDFVEAMRVAARKGGEGVSENVRVVYGPDREVRRVIVDGKEIDPDKTYTLATIDYVAQGNDDLKSIANGRVIWTDSEVMSEPVLGYIYKLTEQGLPIAPDPTPRFVEEVIIK